MKKLILGILVFGGIFFSSCSSSDRSPVPVPATKLPSFTDVDGNSYKIVTIGNQKWTQTNLNVSKYSDGTVIPQVTDGIAWQGLTTGAWCYYKNNTIYGPIYGKLYNWYAVAGIYDAASADNPTLRKKLSPAGWHVPTQDEWYSLIDYLGGSVAANPKLTEAGTAHWVELSGATNSSGFTGLPGGYREYDAAALDDENFFTIGSGSLWWSSSEDGATTAWYRGFSIIGGNGIGYSYPKAGGFSVRCLKN